jgi:hypothetical protein
MKTYRNNGKTYKVESVTYGGQCINVNGTTITDIKKTGLGATGYTVFVDGDEIAFDTFFEAYEFATTKQKDTMRLD